MGNIIKKQDHRREFVNTLNELAEKDPNIIVIICDVGFNYLDNPNLKFKVLNLGVTEASSTIIASALALSGFSVWIYSMINFVLFRNYEMVRNGIVKHNSPVKLLGVKGSSSYKFLGFSHNMTDDEEDVRTCKNLNLKYYIPKSNEEVKRAILESYQDQKASYIRL